MLLRLGRDDQLLSIPVTSENDILFHKPKPVRESSVKSKVDGHCCCGPVHCLLKSKLVVPYETCARDDDCCVSECELYIGVEM